MNATNDRQTARLIQNVADSYAPGSPGNLMALGQLAAFSQRKRIVDPSAHLDRDADSVERAARTSDRRAMGWRKARVRPFGKQARKARALFNLAVAALAVAALITVALGVAANAGV